MKINFLPLLVFFFALIFVSTSCGEDANSTDGEGEEITLDCPKNKVTIGLPVDIETINPLLFATGYESQIVNISVQYLLAFDPEKVGLSPQLAKDFPTVTAINEGEYAGGIAYTFEIHEEAVWDDGTPVTGNDVVFTFKALFNPKMPTDRFRAWLDQVRDIQVDAENPKKITFIFGEKYILGEVVVGNSTVLPAHIYDADNLMKDIPVKDMLDKEKAAQLAETDERLAQFATVFTSPEMARVNYGSGPYEVTEYASGQYVRLKKKENWWGDKLADQYTMLRAYPAEVEYRIFTDPVASASALRNKELTIMATIDTKEFLKLKEESEMQAYYNFATPSTYLHYFININRRNEILDDKHVRRALAHLIDVDQVIEKIYDGFATRRTGPIDASKPYFDKSMQSITYDVEKAKQILADAGWEDTNNDGILDKEINGERKELIVEYLASANSKFSSTLAPLFAEQAKPAGVQIDYVAKDFTSVRDALVKRTYEISGAGLGGDAILDDLKQLFHTDSDTPAGTNRSGFGDAASDALIDAIRIELDEEKRNKMYKELQQIIYDDQPLIYLFAPQERILISKCFEANATQIKPGYYVPHFKLKK